MSANAVSTTESAKLIKGAGLVSLALAVISPLVGLVASIATFIWARNSGANTKVAIWGIVISVIMIAVSIIVMIIAMSLFASAASLGAVDIQALCAHRDTWGWLIDSLRYVCR